LHGNSHFLPKENNQRQIIFTLFQGNCDAGKQYCCYNSQVTGSNKHRPASFFGNTALHQHYARPEISQGAPQNFNSNLNRPVRGPGILAGPGGPVDIPPIGSGSQIHPRKQQSSSKLPFSNKLFPENN
jgi:hypothetical protein